MGYQIDAYLKNGVPTIEVWDRAKHSKCLHWSYDESCTDGKGCDNNKEHSNSEIKRLFQKLLLLTLKDDLANVRVFKAD